LPSFRAGVRGGRIARELGLSIDPSFEPGSGVRRAIEVYPHPAIVALFELPLTLKYKAKVGPRDGRPLRGVRAAAGAPRGAGGR
jgi:predicted RNase H-like nuclease